jgi:hypothetical protein
MPGLDVNDVLANPLFFTYFDVFRYDQELVDGVTHVSNPKDFRGVSGVVTAIRGRELERFPEEERLSGAIQIYTKFRLTGGKGATSADEVEWPVNSGVFYIVIQVDDWSQFGRGFVQAICTLGQLNPPR